MGGGPLAITARAAVAEALQDSDGRPPLGRSTPNTRSGFVARIMATNQGARGVEWTNQSADFAFMAPMRPEPNQPQYKPEHWG